MLENYTNIEIFKSTQEYATVAMNLNTNFCVTLNMAFRFNLNYLLPVESSCLDFTHACAIIIEWVSKLFMQ